MADWLRLEKLLLSKDDLEAKGNSLLKVAGSITQV